MSLTPFEDIVALGKAPSADPAKADATKEVAELKIQLDGMSRSVPDDQDDLAEDQEIWCARWQKLLSQVHVSFQRTQEYGVDTALEAELLSRMQEANALSKTAWRAAKAALARVAKAAGSGNQESAPVAEPVVESAAPDPVPESADEPPTTESPSEEQESVSSAGQKRKRISNRVVMDEEEDEEEDIVETKCGKSKGKAGRAKKDTAPVLAPKAKGKEKGQQRPVRNNARVVIPARKAPVASSSRVEAAVPDFFGFSPSPEPDSDHEDDDATPRKRAKTSDPARDAAVETMKLALLTMRTKMHGMLGFLTELQARAKVAETYIGSQQLEIEEMEALLEEL
ncbi:hypothetical protein HD554DRAFT_2181136 [Boletus coccyginus]|nr:hypothetical protein HD554DRAFT_2181136 [Boletus coccyginus]